MTEQPLPVNPEADNDDTDNTQLEVDGGDNDTDLETGGEAQDSADQA